MYRKNSAEYNMADSLEHFFFTHMELASGMPAACEVEVHKLLHIHWKLLFESFPTV